MNREKLKNYAALIASAGVNVQNGQDVIITCSPDQIIFIEMLAEQCYLRGARNVRVDFITQNLSKLGFKYRSIESLSTLEKWEQERWKHYVETKPCRIYIESDDPDGLRDADQEKITKSRQLLFPKIKKYRDKIENRYQWCIASVPGPSWAKKLFPDLSVSKAEEKLWETILFTSRADGDNPVKAWKEHNKVLHGKCDKLNKLRIKSLHYTSSNGTDFTVGLIPQGIFCGGAETSLEGITFNPNIPSEECFTTPMRTSAEGIVYAAKPLSWQGQLIENFWFRFSGGKVCDFGAEKNRDLLEKMVNMDKGASYLGECALVPYSSPVSQSGILFYNTLFDENAACHLALGKGFADTIRDFDKYSLKQCRDMGVNDSMIHVDFMIGTKDMNITADCGKKKPVQIFKDGDWAF